MHRCRRLQKTRRRNLRSPQPPHNDPLPYAPNLLHRAAELINGRRILDSGSPERRIHLPEQPRRSARTPGRLRRTPVQSLDRRATRTTGRRRPYAGKHEPGEHPHGTERRRQGGPAGHPRRRQARRRRRQVNYRDPPRRHRAESRCGQRTGGLLGGADRLSRPGRLRSPLTGCTGAASVLN